MNKITLIGNLTHDPEVRSTPSGVTICTFTIAVNRRFANQSGERQTDFFRINAWRQLGDTCARYLQKGRKVAVVGELQRGPTKRRTAPPVCRLTSRQMKSSS